MISSERNPQTTVVTTRKELLKPGEIPALMVVGRNLPEVWENAVLATWEFGTTIPTEYDGQADPESRDATSMLTITEPLSEPRLHKSFPGGLDELYVYVEEVVLGVHDDWVGNRGWSYSYHDRLTNWPGIGGFKRIDELAGQDLVIPGVNQVQAMINKLAAVPHSRRAQAITWNPYTDAIHSEPPCLQRIWGRVVRSGAEEYLLEMNTHWRSRDALKAAFMNMFAITTLQAVLATEISLMSGKQVGVGTYIDVSDSWHIYGSYVRQGDMDKFLHAQESRTFEDRTWRTDDPVVSKLFEVGKKSLVGS